ncbi:MAG: hypothetical protein Q4E55_05120 [Bacteroidales bacterium]|nr:hypothetical protein [Bacteroidales bacterium]
MMQTCSEEEVAGWSRSLQLRGIIVISIALIAVSGLLGALIYW